MDLGFQGWVRVSGGKVPTPEAWEVRQGRKAHRGGRREVRSTVGEDAHWSKIRRDLDAWAENCSLVP